MTSVSTFDEQMWDNKNAPAGATNALRGLTHSSGTSREGLPMKGTRTLIAPPIALSPEWVANFWRRVNKTDGCWLWTGATIKGYGQVHIARIDGKSVTWYAHRAAWHLDGRPLHDGLTLDHLCKTPLCVRPDHLDEVTNSENLQRAHSKRTHCKRGHELTDENTVNKRVTPGGFQARTCRTCVNDSQRRRAALRKAQA